MDLKPHSLEFYLKFFCFNPILNVKQNLLFQIVKAALQTRILFPPTIGILNSTSSTPSNLKCILSTVSLDLGVKN